MMYDLTTSITGVGTSPVLSLSPARNIWSVSVQSVVTGTITFDVEGTVDGANWVKVYTGLTTGGFSNIATPCRGLRIVSTAGTGTVVATLLEIR